MKFDISINEDGTRKVEFYHLDRSVTSINLDRKTCEELANDLLECKRAEEVSLPLPDETCDDTTPCGHCNKCCDC